MKALFVGLGSIGQRHLRNLKKLRPDIDIMAVRSTNKAPVLSDLNQIVSDLTVREHYQLKEFASLQEALRQKPDMVFVTNPTSLHIEVVRTALASGCYIFVEKPLSHDWEGVDELITAERNTGSNRIAIGYQFRFNPALHLIKKILTEKLIGRVTGAQLINGEYMPGWHPYEDYRTSYAARKDLGGGAIVTQIHDFDYAIWLFGKPDQLFAVGGQLSELEVDVEDSVHILMKCKDNGKTLPVTISLDYLQWPPKRTINIVGDRGSIQCNLIKMEVIVNDRVNDHIETHNFPNFDRNKLFLDQMSNFLAFVSGKEIPVVNLNNGADSLRVALAARASMETESVKKIS
jgi:predicted dehydrogenase